ncbi:MAG: hypothetical protein LQ342_003727 [Letrouitia transgressa]|nr:MAG: hypothetical protein LQ342_003727 [Letrouitia transgressa]
METEKFTYKFGDNGEPLEASVHWLSEAADQKESSKPIVLILHGGGMTVGSNAMIPKSQIAYLASLNFVVVSPNYRLCPQVTAAQGAFADTFSAYTWCRTELPSLLKNADGNRIATMGHSVGGTLALSLALQPHPPKVIASFYPTLYISDLDSSAHKSFTGFPPLPEWTDTPENKAALLNQSAGGAQISAFPVYIPGLTQPQPRHIWFLSQLRTGNWIAAMQPDKNYEAIDPCVRLREKGTQWPPTVIVQGDLDDLPGSGIEYVNRAVKDLKGAGAKLVEVEIAEGESHMFDMKPEAAVGQEGKKAEVVKKALDFLRKHV